MVELWRWIRVLTVQDIVHKCTVQYQYILHIYRVNLLFIVTRHNCFKKRMTSQNWALIKHFHFHAWHMYCSSDMGDARSSQTGSSNMWDAGSWYLDDAVGSDTGWHRSSTKHDANTVVARWFALYTEKSVFFLEIILCQKSDFIWISRYFKSKMLMSN